MVSPGDNSLILLLIEPTSSFGDIITVSALEGLQENSIKKAAENTAKWDCIIYGFYKVFRNKDPYKDKF